MAARLSADPGNNETRFGLGMISFARAIERYWRSQYRYGLRAPRTVSIPLLRFPVPVNPTPEEISYEKQRETLRTLLDDLANAEATLAPMTDAPVRSCSISTRSSSTCAATASQTIRKLSAILASLRMTRADPAGKAEPFEVAFDNADALWLRGYAHLLSASIEFVLAYDWHVTFERAGRCSIPAPRRRRSATRRSRPARKGATGFSAMKLNSPTSSRSLTKSAGRSPRAPGYGARTPI